MGRAMAGIIEVVARRLGISPERLEREALEVWLRRKLALVEAEIAEILARYGVRSAEELEERIRRGEVAEHPAWEDLITLERLFEEKRKLSEALRF
ncbi:MAG: hypothetical protein GXO32_08900 [Crenarchaeota archaeon]|nr:hypothetical protein [Thermoproteota archaeon]